MKCTHWYCRYDILTWLYNIAFEIFKSSLVASAVERLVCLQVSIWSDIADIIMLVVTRISRQFFSTGSNAQRSYVYFYLYVTLFAH